MRGIWQIKEIYSRPDNLKSGRVGFTLIELLIAISIIAVLSVVAIVAFTSAQKKSRDARRKADLEQMRSALEMYRADNNQYLGTTTFTKASTALSVLAPTYIPLIPVDPLSTQDYYYKGVQTGTAWTGYNLSANLEAETMPTPTPCLPNTGQNYCVPNP